MDERIDGRWGWARWLIGGALGLALLAGGLALWRLASDAAAFFAPILAACGIGCHALAPRLDAQSWAVAARALRVAGGGAIGLAVVAALSLGALLPPPVAEWVSPALGRFGGPLALGLVALAAAFPAARGRVEGRGGALDLATLCGVGAAWVWAQTARQISFPTPPTTTETLLPRLQLLLGLASALGLGALVLAVLGRRCNGGRQGWPGAWCLRWGVVAAMLGLVIGLALRAAIAPWFALPLALGLGLALVGQRGRGPRAALLTVGCGVGWLVLVTLALALLYGATSEDLEVVFLRNTVEGRALDFWRGAFGDERTITRPSGALAGTVRDTAGRPIGGASVVVADATGRAFSATSAPDGRYALAGVPRGNYLPLAVGPDHRQGGRAGLAGRVATVRAGRTAGSVDFRLAPRPAYDPATNDTLQLGAQTELVIEGLATGTTLRRPFTFANRGKTLDGGLIHEPPTDLGSGPFPILLIIYPGEAASWEGVSAPLAARGFVVVSYFPRRLLDLDGDMDDLRLLLNLTAAERLSARGDGGRVALAGGSVSTVYTYLLARDLAGSPRAPRVRAAVQYGGLFDLYAFRRSWEEGDVIIDPGISQLEYLLVAFGRPDTRPEFYLRLSPRYALGPASLPPTLLVHAEQDIIVPPAQSRLAADGLARAAIPHRLLLYPELEHYLDIGKRDPAQLDMLEQTVAFLREWSERR